MLVSIRKTIAFIKWKRAEKDLDKILLKKPIGHPEAQKLLEKEINAYEERLKFYPDSKDESIYLNQLRSMLNPLRNTRVKRKSHLKSV